MPLENGYQKLALIDEFGAWDIGVSMVTIPVIPVPHGVTEYRYVVILLMFKTLSIRKCSWKHKAIQLSSKPKERHLNYTPKRASESTWLKYSFTEMLKFFYDLQDHSPTDVPTDLFWKLIHAIKNIAKTTSWFLQINLFHWNT